MNTMSCNRCRDVKRIPDPVLIGKSIDCPDCMRDDDELCGACGERIEDCDEMREDKR